MSEVKKQTSRLPASCYLLLGPEVGKKNEFVRQIKSSLEKSFGGEIDSYTFYPYDSDVVEIISIMNNISLFAAAKLVLIKNCQDLKDKDAALIAEYIKNPSKDCVLLLATEEMKVSPAIKKVIPNGCEKIFWEMYKNEKPGWVRQFFNKEKIEIENNAVGFLVDILEGDTETFKNECGKLALFFGQGETITEEKIANFFYNRKEENIFSLFDYIAQCNLEKSVIAAENMLLSGKSETGRMDPVKIIGDLSWHIKKIYEIKKSIAEKKSFSEACAELNIRATKMQGMYSSAIQNYSIKEIEKIITLTAQYVVLFRSAIRAEVQNIMLPVYLYSVIVKRGEDIVGLART